jgi:hypothetical protein
MTSAFTAYAGLADVALAGLAFARHYGTAVDPRLPDAAARTSLSPPSADARLHPRFCGRAGRPVLEDFRGLAWGYCRHDHYVGYVEG